jgi:NAD(P)-dependent dehydrogenase (short-subunit alcohol dehydrogenase family)
MLLAEKVALISGGAKGMGQGMVFKLASEGCTVAIADINIKEAEGTIEEVVKKGGRGLAIKCDVTDGKQIKAAVEKVISQFGKIDILVNNAGGILDTPPIEDLSEETWDKTMNLNLKSDFWFCKYVVPYMKAQKHGKIVCISSIGGINPPHHAIAYNTAKAAIVGFTYDLAWALAPFNLNVNCLLPGPIQTHFYDKRMTATTEAEKEAFFAGLGKKVPLGRIGTPEDIGNAVLFLVSEMSSFITGTAIPIAGGLPLMPQNIQFK